MPTLSFGLAAYRGGVELGGSRASVPEEYHGGESGQGGAVPLFGEGATGHVPLLLLAVGLPDCLIIHLFVASSPT
jgi:hypothetical protein